MDDTSIYIKKKMSEMIQKKLPIERMKMGWSMYETSKVLIIRSIVEKNPEISKADLKKEFFLKFYGNDFTPTQRAKIINHLTKLD